MTLAPLTLGDADFWQRPLQARMDDFAAMQEVGPFTPASTFNELTQEIDNYFAVTRYAELVEISRRAQDFCSGRGSISIIDMPSEASEFFGSFITLDDPRHHRQRSIVARSFTTQALHSVLDSVETIGNEVIDGMCEKGEVDLVEADRKSVV